MSYLYYPGCSLTSSAREYDLATRAVLAACDIQLTEIEGWTCCGASAAAPINKGACTTKIMRQPIGAIGGLRHLQAGPPR